MTAADRSAALLRQLDQSLHDDPMHHAPNCPRPGVAVERGYSCTVTRCLGCGALTAERNVPKTQPKATKQ
jgi:hypothetical protein